MSQHFYDNQLKRVIAQFMRAMSFFTYETGDGTIVQVPVRFGDVNRQVGAILNKNSENVIQSAPFIACYIKDVKYDRSRLQDPTFVSKLNIRERAYDSVGNEYLNTQGANYTVERIMPAPYIITFNADIWTSNLDQKFQLFEQIVPIFNPSLEIQTTDNYIDWTSLSTLELTDGCVFESRTVPQGLSNDISICTLQFTAPIWITPPAKVKQLGIITKIITNVFDTASGTGENGGYIDALLGGDIFSGIKPAAKVVVTPNNYSLLVLNNTAVLVPVGYSDVDDSWLSVLDVPGRPTWMNLLDLYPGKFKAGSSQLRLSKTSGGEIVATMALNPANEALMQLTIDSDTIPSNTPITASAITRGTIDAIINPLTFNPGTVAVDTRYLILEDITGTAAFKSIALVGFYAKADDIIQWDGNQWNVIFSPLTTTALTYVTNSYTGVQYKWESGIWAKSFEEVYTNDSWRLLL